MNRIRRIAAALAGLALTWLGLATTAPAAFAVQVQRGGGKTAWEIAHHGGDPAGSGAATVTRTVVVGGMPGWQIFLIAAGAFLLAATIAVLLDRARARRNPATTAA